jgi:hypothetical protein
MALITLVFPSAAFSIVFGTDLKYIYKVWHGDALHVLGQVNLVGMISFQANPLDTKKLV